MRALPRRHCFTPEPRELHGLSPQHMVKGIFRYMPQLQCWNVLAWKCVRMSDVPGASATLSVGTHAPARTRVRVARHVNVRGFEWTHCGAITRNVSIRMRFWLPCIPIVSAGIVCENFASEEIGVDGFTCSIFVCESTCDILLRKPHVKFGFIRVVCVLQVRDAVGAGLE